MAYNIISKRNVLFLLPSLGLGGAERVVVTLLRHLNRNRFHLSLVLVNKNVPVLLSEVPEDVEVIKLNCIRVFYAIPKLVWLIWRHRPDVVFSGLSHLNIFLAIIRPLLSNKTYYVARESSIISEVVKMYQCPWLWIWAYRHFYWRYDKMICQSSVMRDDLVNNFSYPADKITVINNPVDVRHIRSLAREKINTGLIKNDDATCNHGMNLVAVGRMSSEKKYDLIIKAIALIENKQIRLTLVGDGPLRQDLEKLAKVCGVASQIRFVGYQVNPYPFIDQADALVLSSKFEGFPNVVLEALACGTPIIATPAIGGLREIIEGVPGCIITNEVSAISLSKAIADFPPGCRLSSDVVLYYDVEQIVGLYEKVLESCDP